MSVDSGRIPLGRLAGTHGVRGDFRVSLYNSESNALKGIERVFLEGDDLTPVAVQQSRRHGRGWLLRLDVPTSPEAVKNMLGLEVFIALEDLEEPDDGEYFHFQLIGLDVFNENGERIGRVREVLVAGSSDLLAIDAEGGECLVPIVGEFIREVDLETGRIVLRPIPGLLDPAK